MAIASRSLTFCVGMATPIVLAHAGHLGRVEQRVMSAIVACRTADRSPACSVACSSNACESPSTRTPSDSSAVSRNLADPAAFAAHLAAARRVDWIVYAKKPFGGPAQVLAYLGRYTHRVAIANSRIQACDDDHVTFTWKDYRDDGAVKTMSLKPDEFIRRFLLHALPDGFHRIRHFEFLANGHRTQKLALCRSLLTNEVEPTAHGKEEPPIARAGRTGSASILRPVRNAAAP